MTRDRAAEGTAERRRVITRRREELEVSLLQSDGGMEVEVIRIRMAR